MVISCDTDIEPFGLNCKEKTCYLKSFKTYTQPQKYFNLSMVYGQLRLKIKFKIPGSFDSHQQKNNLVFHGIEPDKMEKDMAMVCTICFLGVFSLISAPQEPDFCRDILETRIKMLLREHLKISRDISFFKVGSISRLPFLIFCTTLSQRV